MAIQGFATPAWFLLVLVVAVIVAGHVWWQRRRRRYTMRFTNLALLERVAPRRPGWPRHVPPALLAVGLLVLVMALAGPMGPVRVARDRAVVLLVVDVSLSMNATDVTPSRLAAAEDAATRFARALPQNINLGLEEFSGTAEVLVAPTVDHEQSAAALTHLQLGPSTATGDAIAAALAAIAQFDATVPGHQAGPPPARIVLMSDGKQTVGRDEFQVAAQAGAAHVPISTISFGTPTGSVSIDGQDVPVPVADGDLAQVAALSGGTFYPAHSGDQVHEVYGTLSRQIGYQTITGDISKPWFVVGTLLVMAAALAGLVISQRVPG